MPLHPMLVHFPIALAVLVPIATIALVALSSRIPNPRMAWGAMLVMCVLLTGSSFVAMEMGEEDEEKVEKVLSEKIIEEHAELGEAFVFVTLLPLIFTGLLAFKSNNNALKGAAVVSSLVVLALAIETGHHGAELVYKYNAGRAFSLPLSSIPVGESGEHEEHERD